MLKPEPQAARPGRGQAGARRRHLSMLSCGSTKLNQVCALCICIIALSFPAAYLTYVIVIVLNLHPSLFTSHKMACLHSGPRGPVRYSLCVPWRLDSTWPWTLSWRPRVPSTSRLLSSISCSLTLRLIPSCPSTTTTTYHSLLPILGVGDPGKIQSSP